MNNRLIAEVVERVASMKDTPVDGALPTRFVSRVLPPTEWDRTAVERELSVSLPTELARLWELSSDMYIYEDAEYGQWGLAIFGPKEALLYHAYRVGLQGSDFIYGDFAIGGFAGDEEFVVLRCEKSAEDHGSVLIGSTSETRSRWKVVSPTLSDFLYNFIEYDVGKKYWE